MGNPSFAPWNVGEIRLLARANRDARDRLELERVEDSVVIIE